LIVGNHSQLIEKLDVDNDFVQEASTPYAEHPFSDYVLSGKDCLPWQFLKPKRLRLMPLLVANKISKTATKFSKYRKRV
jgi:hypothetical protein